MDRDEPSLINPQKTAWNITLIYATLGLIWIFFSDWIISSLFHDSQYLVIANMVKGWAYVFATSLLLFVLVSAALGQAKRIHEQLRHSELKAKQQLKENLGYQNRLKHLAYYDALTDLPNRLSLQRDLQSTLDAEEHFGLFFVDLDNFKNVNDFRSHEAGDLLLQKVAGRLRSCLTDSKGIYRFGGDEFIIISPSTSLEEAENAAQNILACFQEPFTLQNSVVHLTPSVGLTYSSGDNWSCNDLIKYADLAMYKSKQRGGNCHTVFCPELMHDGVEGILLEQQIRSMWQNRQFTLFYQPEISISNQSIGGFEALLRWEPRDLVQASVEEIIKVAESTGLIIPIGEWILKEACTFAKQAHAKGYLDTYISVNISIVQFSHYKFAQSVLEALQEVDLDPSYLRLEITESVFMESYELIESQLEPLRKLGVKIALDDFGKGYSSLSYLKDLPLDTLKIDKSFIDQVTDNNKDALLASHIITIGNSLALQVVAEGVETPEQLEYLKEQNCQRFQGYLYSPPLPAERALALLERERPLDADRDNDGKVI